MQLFILMCHAQEAHREHMRDRWWKSSGWRVSASQAITDWCRVILNGLWGWGGGGDTEVVRTYTKGTQSNNPPSIYNTPLAPIITPTHPHWHIMQGPTAPSVTLPTCCATNITRQINYINVTEILKHPTMEEVPKCERSVYLRKVEQIVCLQVNFYIKYSSIMLN